MSNNKKTIWFSFKCKRGKDYETVEEITKHPEVIEALLFSEKFILKDDQKSAKNFYPGVVFVKTFWNKGEIAVDLYEFLTNYKYFLRFQSYRATNEPVLIADREIIKMIDGLKETKIKSTGKFAPEEIDFAVNDFVTVLNGVFRGYEGEVIEIDYNTGIITLNIEFFGRMTPIQIGFKECKRMIN